jgi:tryptophan-rich sensory protein
MPKEKPKLPTKQKQDNNEQEDQQDSLDHLVAQIKEQLDDPKQEIQVVRINSKKPTWKQLVFTTILSFVFDLLLIISINGYLQFTESKILNIIVLSLLFSLIELVFRRLVTRYFFHLMISSLGTIMIPLMIVSFIIAWLITPDLEPLSNGLVLLFFLIFIVARSVMRILFMGRNKIIEIKKVKK